MLACPNKRRRSRPHAQQGGVHQYACCNVLDKTCSTNGSANKDSSASTRCCTCTPETNRCPSPVVLSPRYEYNEPHALSMFSTRSSALGRNGIGPHSVGPHCSSNVSAFRSSWGVTSAATATPTAAGTLFAEAAPRVIDAGCSCACRVRMMASPVPVRSSGTFGPRSYPCTHRVYARFLSSMNAPVPARKGRESEESGINTRTRERQHTKPPETHLVAHCLKCALEGQRHVE
jgi:hypothetical protein